MHVLPERLCLTKPYSDRGASMMPAGRAGRCGASLCKASAKADKNKEVWCHACKAHDDCKRALAPMACRVLRGHHHG